MSHCGKRLLGFPTIYLMLQNTVHIEMKHILHRSFLIVHTTCAHIQCIYSTSYPCKCRLQKKVNCWSRNISTVNTLDQIQNALLHWTKVRGLVELREKNCKGHMTSENKHYSVGKRQTGAIMQKKIEETQNVFNKCILSPHSQRTFYVRRRC